jgi:hypothetical protein
MSKDEPRGSWYLVTGVILGALLGGLYSRYFQPVRYVDTAPATLQSEFKDQYRSLIAAAYLSNGDLVRARARLELLGDANISRSLTEQAQRTLARDGSSDEARALGLLAIALGQAPPGPVQAITQDPGRPTTSSPLSTPAELGDLPPGNPTSFATQGDSPETATTGSGKENETTLISTKTPGSFVLTGRQEVCDQPLPEPLVQIQVSDPSGGPVPGVIVIVTWAGGEERFFTGLKPEKGLGYADYTLIPDFVYSIRLGESGAPLGDIRAVSCISAGSEPFWGAVALSFSQP